MYIKCTSVKQPTHTHTHTHKHLLPPLPPQLTTFLSECERGMMKRRPLTLRALLMETSSSRNTFLSPELFTSHSWNLNLGTFSLTQVSAHTALALESILICSTHHTHHTITLLTLSHYHTHHTITHINISYSDSPVTHPICQWLRMCTYSPIAILATNVILCLYTCISPI